jgi:hypothetical protein
MQDKEVKCDNSGGIKEVYLFNASDWIYDYKTESYRLKRKYGKFNRQGFKCKK